MYYLASRFVHTCSKNQRRILSMRAGINASNSHDSLKPKRDGDEAMVRCYGKKAHSIVASLHSIVTSLHRHRVFEHSIVTSLHRHRVFEHSIVPSLHRHCVWLRTRLSFSAIIFITLRISANCTTIYGGHCAENATIAHCRPAVTNEIDQTKPTERNRTNERMEGGHVFNYKMPFSYSPTHVFNNKN